MKMSRLRYNNILSIIACCLGIFITQGFAQSPVPTIEDLEDHERLIISEEAKLVAEEYADILKELQELTLDYSKTFSRLRDESSILRIKELNSLVIKLANGQYLDDIDLLTDDLAKVRAKLREQEIETKKKARHLENQDRKKALKAIKLSRSLRGDLEDFDIVLQEDINFRLLNLKSFTNEIQICLTQLSHDDLFLFNESLTSYMMILGDSIESVISLEIESHAPFFEVGDVPEVNVHVYPAPEVPAAPSAYSYSYFYHQKSGEAIATKEFSDSLKVRSSKIPIYINNPTGNIEITGWDKRAIFVTSNIEIVSHSEDEARFISDNTILNLISEDTGIFIELKMPKIKSSHTNINNFQLEIKVPHKNPIIGTSAFGKVHLINLENKINFTSNKSDVFVGDVIGDINITNNMGPMNIEEVEGSIELANNFSPILISECIGDVKASNTYSLIKAIECVGGITISNSGTINLYENIGNVTITNTKGFIEIKDHQGDISAYNSFEPVILEDIFGEVDVVNMRGIIKAEYVNGPLRAVNQFAPIFAYNNEGSLDLSSTRGLIDVILTNVDEGTSSISSEFGEIKLAFPEDIDLAFKSELIGGKIISSFPINKKAKGDTIKGEYIFGDGGSVLQVIGKSSKVILSSSY